MKKQGLITLAEVLIDPDYPFRKTEIGWCRDTGFEPVGDYGRFFFYTLTFRSTDEPLPEEGYGAGGLMPWQVPVSGLALFLLPQRSAAGALSSGDQCIIILAVRA